MDILQLVREAGKAADSKKAEDLVILDLRGISTITDSFVICSVSNVRQAKAVAEAVEENLSGLGVRVDHIEGYPECTWILMDYIDLIVHIFTKDAREYYDLEHLWGDAPRVELDE